MKFVEFFEQYQSVIYPSIIALFAVGYKIYNGIKKKRDELLKADTEKHQARNREKFRDWEHNESMMVISHIQKMCDLYRDKSTADRAAYFQLENGTVAMSRLCNMFLSCLCEDNRYSAFPKELRSLQRIPYSRVASWVEEMSDIANSPNQRYLISVGDSEVLKVINGVYSASVNTQLAAPVFDYNNVFVGVVVLDYKNPVNKIVLNNQIGLLLDFRASIYTRLVAYYESRKEKQAELKIREWSE